MKHFLLLATGWLLLCHAMRAQDYKNPKLPIQARVADLLKRMTIEEKVGQLRSLFAANPKMNDALFKDGK